MYNFIDTNEALESNILPSEALNINGDYIENMIPGYRTLYVKGRESLSPSIDAVEVGSKDGAFVKNRRYQPRTITVGYQLIAESNEAFRNAYNALGRILNKEESILIFNDEQDKFFKGTLDSMGEVEPGRNAIKAEFDLVCIDPFKYSVVEYEAVSNLSDNSILIDYNGSYKSYPTLEAEFYKESEFDESGSSTALSGKGDCGYIAFFNEKEKIIQLGDPDELDGEEAFAKSQTLISQEFRTSGAFGTNQKAPWATNSGNVLEGSAKSGSVAMGVATYGASQTQKETSATLGKYSNTAARPYTYYTVSCKATNRTANSVKLTFSITCSLESTGWVGNGYGLKVGIYIGGAWRETTMKEIKAYWKGSAGHTVNISYTVTGLSKATTSISGIKFRATRLDSLGDSWGTISERATNAMPIAAFIEDTPETYYLNASSYGSGNGWHGPSITRTIPNDASGVSGAKDYTLTFQQLFDCTDSMQIGAFQAIAFDSSDKCIAGVRICKRTAGNTAEMALYVNSKKVDEIDVSIPKGSSVIGTSTIIKQGSSVRFNIGGISKAYYDAGIKEIKSTKLTFMFECYEGKPYLNHNGLYYVKFVKNNCDTYRDIPNKFSANDVVKANCSNGEITLNGIQTPSLGALANDWEGFTLEPGLNQIGFSYSDWVENDYKPKVKVKYREVFL